MIGRPGPRRARRAVLALGLLALAAGSGAQPEPDPLAALRARLEERDFEGAERASRDRLRELEAGGEDGSLEAAAVLDVLVEVFWQTENLGDESEALARRALEIKERALGPDDPRLVGSLNNLGIVHELRGDFEAARALYERALAIQESSLGPDAAEVAFSLVNLGILARTTGDYFAARDHFQRAVDIRLDKLAPDDARLGFSLHNLATAQWDLGDLTGARRNLERAVEVLEPALGPDDPRLADAIEVLGIVHQRIGELEVAQDFYERTLAIREAAVGPDHLLVHYSLANLGSVLVARGRPAEARAHLERALAIVERALDPLHKDMGPVLHNLAEAVALDAGYAAARPVFARAHRFWEEAFGPEHPGVAWTLHLEAGFQIRAGERAAAESGLRRAIRIWRSRVGADHPRLVDALSDLAWNLAAAGRDREALRTALEAADQGRRHVRLTVRGLPERQGLRYAAAGLAPLDLALALAAREPGPSAAPAWDALIRSRALVLDEVAARVRLASADPEASALVRELAAAREQLATLFVRSQGSAAEELTAALARARAEKERVERELAEKSVVFREMQQRDRFGLDEVREALPPGAALLAYARVDPEGAAPHESEPARPTPPRYVAFTLRAGGAPRLTPLGPAARIEDLATRWRQRIAMEARRPGRDPSVAERVTAQVGALLRRAVWDPVEEHLEGAETVFVVLDGLLHQIRLAALPTRDGRYLVESRRIFALSTERDLVPGRRPATGRGLLALGDPTFDADRSPPRQAADGAAAATRDACAFEAPFERLPGSGREVREIASAWTAQGRAGAGDPAPVELLGAAASEAALKRLAPGRRVLHLATHGYFLRNDCAGGAPRTGPGEVNPLLRSGLVLAGANRRASASASREDGILTAEEIAALDLEGLEWAVLSACETGLGAIRANEGVFGLRRAFQLAGARTVVMSLWPVDDVATVRFMRALYEGRFVRGATTAEALHEATLGELRRRRRGDAGAHPFYWAPFVAVGDWR